MSEAPQPAPSGQQPSGSGGSRSLWTVVAIALGAVVLAGILFIVLRPDDSEPAADTIATEPTTTAETTTEVTTEETTTDETTTEETTTEETTTTTAADGPQRVNVRFQNGEVVGGLVEAEIEQGTRVALVVRADVTDEVHLHGYDLFTNVVPGQVGRILFTADKPGVFEAELEDLGVPIAELTVNP